MNPQQLDPLAGLRDIHLPADVSWWPPAPGWWLLALTALAAIILVMRRLLRWRRLNAPRRASLQLLEQYYASWQSTGDTATFSRQVNELLRRAALTAYDPEQVASLTGADWIAFLDQQLPAADGFAAWGHHFEDFPYRPQTHAAELDSLYAITQRWLREYRVQP